MGLPIVILATVVDIAVKLTQDSKTHSWRRSRSRPGARSSPVPRELKEADTCTTA